MPPALLAFVMSLIPDLLQWVAPAAADWLVPHVVKWIIGHIRENYRLGPSWTWTPAISNAAEGIVTVTLYRSGRTAGVFTVFPLEMTAAHEKTIAALAEVLFHDGENIILGLFSKARAGAAKPLPANVTATGAIALPG